MSRHSSQGLVVSPGQPIGRGTGLRTATPERTQGIGNLSQRSGGLASRQGSRTGSISRPGSAPAVTSRNIATLLRAARSPEERAAILSAADRPSMPQGGALVRAQSPIAQARGRDWTPSRRTPMLGLSVAEKGYPISVMRPSEGDQRAANRAIIRITPSSVAAHAAPEMRKIIGSPALVNSTEGKALVAEATLAARRAAKRAVTPPPVRPMTITGVRATSTTVQQRSASNRVAPWERKSTASIYEQNLLTAHRRFVTPTRKEAIGNNCAVIELPSASSSQNIDGAGALRATPLNRNVSPHRHARREVDVILHSPTRARSDVRAENVISDGRREIHGRMGREKIDHHFSQQPENKPRARQPLGATQRTRHTPLPQNTLSREEKHQPRSLRHVGPSCDRSSPMSGSASNPMLIGARPSSATRGSSAPRSGKCMVTSRDPSPVATRDRVMGGGIAMSDQGATNTSSRMAALRSSSSGSAAAPRPVGRVTPTRGRPSTSEPVHHRRHFSGQRQQSSVGSLLAW